MGSEERHIIGISASPGIAIGSAFLLKKKEAVAIGISLESEEAIMQEIEKFDTAVKLSVAELETAQANSAHRLNRDELDILEAQIEMLNDPQIREDVIEKIKEDRKNAHDAVMEVIGGFVALFNNMQDDYMRARAVDVKDAGDRILSHLNGQYTRLIHQFDKDIILIAADLAASDTLTMDITHVVGLATQAGGKTSHAAIIAKSREIPAVAGCGEMLEHIRDNDIIIMDGLSGTVIVNPGQACQAEYDLKKKEYLEKTNQLRSLKNTAAITSDGKEITLLANISGADDMERGIAHGAAGSGLFRTELLFLGRSSFPDEEEQFEFYKKVAVQSGKRPVIVRTLDIGGDKQLPYFGIPGEQNPFLGYRAIRIFLDRKDLFMIQLKAILRASLFGNFKIMFPMISSVQELRRAKELLEEAKAELSIMKIGFDSGIAVGIMIEIPAAAIMADVLAKEVDFFSIGTNDLCQYTLAADRTNEKVKEIYDPYNPAVLRLIDRVIVEANKNNIGVGICGELAADPLAVKLLLGMGLEEFSMSASAIPAVKNVVIGSSMTGNLEIYKRVMEMDDPKKIRSFLEGQAV